MRCANHLPRSLYCPRTFWEILMLMLFHQTLRVAMRFFVFRQSGSSPESKVTCVSLVSCENWHANFIFDENCFIFESYAQIIQSTFFLLPRVASKKVALLLYIPLHTSSWNDTWRAKPESLEHCSNSHKRCNSVLKDENKLPGGRSAADPKQGWNRSCRGPVANLSPGVSKNLYIHLSFSLFKSISVDLNCPETEKTLSGATHIPTVYRSSSEKAGLLTLLMLSESLWMIQCIT